MDGTMIDNPFFEGDVPEVHLPSAPLIRVLAQVRFPKIPELVTEEGIAPLRSRLKSRYPILRQEKAFNLVITNDGVASQQSQQESIWRLHDKEDFWKVYVSDSFVTLETSSYTSRDHFFASFDELLSAVGELYEPVLFDRLGVRYVNRLEGVQLDSLDRYARAELLGGPLSVPPHHVAVQHCLTQAQYKFDDEQLDARWGILPPGASIDPAIPPSPERTWLLDLDISSSTPGDFNATLLSQAAKQYAERAYKFFIWAAQPALLNEVGGLDA